MRVNVNEVMDPWDGVGEIGNNIEQSGRENPKTYRLQWWGGVREMRQKKGSRQSKWNMYENAAWNPVTL